MKDYGELLQKMTIKDLKNLANQYGIDLQGIRKKDTIITTIKGYLEQNNINLSLEEELTMSEFNEEMEVKEEVGTEVPETAATTAGKVWYNNAGEEVTMSAFIREKFTEDNLSRKEISEQFGINYRTVYGATVNMTNDAVASARGRSAQNITINVTEDGHVVSTKTIEGEEVYFIDGVQIEPNDQDEIIVPATVEVKRNDWIKEQVANGVDRAAVAKALEISYGVVYGLTKAEGSGRVQHTVTVDGKEISRAEYIRQQVAAGVKKSDIAHELGVEYSVVWQACKKDKTDAEKLANAIAALEKFADKVTDAEGFAIVIEQLKGFEIKEVDEAIESTEA